MKIPPTNTDQRKPTVQERALAILREFEQVRQELVGEAVILSDGKAGSVEKVMLDELHGLRVNSWSRGRLAYRDREIVERELIGGGGCPPTATLPSEGNVVNRPDALTAFALEKRFGRSGYRASSARCAGTRRSAHISARGV